MIKNGLFSALRARIERNRLGELLVRRGKLTPDQLREALKLQQQTGSQLGSVLTDLDYISKTQMRATLIEQAGYRFLTAVFAMFLGVSSFSLMGSAKAQNYNAVKPSTTSQQAMVHKAAFHPTPRLTPSNPAVKRKAPMAFPELFGTKEVASTDISAFKKWTDVLKKLDKVTFKSTTIDGYRDLPLGAKVEAVNDYVNKITYIEDKDNYYKSDYWATPDEFFAKGGDCEDFAIAKYALLKSLGVEERRMRLAIVQDKVKNIPHAVLIVYTDDKVMILDNQIKQARDMVTVDRYKPIYSINATGWWRHLS